MRHKYRKKVYTKKLPRDKRYKLWFITHVICTNISRLILVSWLNINFFYPWINLETLINQRTEQNLGIIFENKNMCYYTKEKGIYGVLG